MARSHESVPRAIGASPPAGPPPVAAPGGSPPPRGPERKTHDWRSEDSETTTDTYPTWEEFINEQNKRVSTQMEEEHAEIKERVRQGSEPLRLRQEEVRDIVDRVKDGLRLEEERAKALYQDNPYSEDIRAQYHESMRRSLAFSGQISNEVHQFLASGQLGEALSVIESFVGLDSLKEIADSREQ